MTKTPANLRSLARAYTDEGIRTIAAIMRDPNQPGSTRLMACEMLFNRGWGKAQPIGGEDGDGQLTIIIRNIMEPKLIELELEAEK